jgi:serine/threonine-protein kinase
VYNLRRFQRGVLKVLKRKESWTQQKEAKALARLRREIKTAKAIKHPCVVEVLDDNLHSDVEEPWVIYEYMPFGSLKAHLEAYRGDVWRCLRVARDVALGLRALHSRNLIHRDIKPPNILLRDLDHAVIGDLGIIHDADATDITSTGESVLALWYGPPEATSGRLDDPRPNFDIYSLGKVIYMMLVGGSSRFPPFARERFEAGEADLTKILGRADLLPVNGLLRRMIVEEPEKRIQTADELIRSIDELVLTLFGRQTMTMAETGRPAAASPTGPSSTGRPRRKRKKS